MSSAVIKMDEIVNGVRRVSWTANLLSYAAAENGVMKYGVI